MGISAEQMAKELEAGKAKAVELSPEEVAQMLKSGEASPVEEEGFWSGLLGGAAELAGEVGEAVDSFTGVPTREAMAEYYKGGDVGDIAGEFFSSMGQDPKSATTPDQLAELQGFEDKPPEILEKINQGSGGRYTNPKTGATVSLLQKDQTTAKDVASGVNAFAADWTNVVPMTAALKLLGKGAGATAKGVAKVMTKAPAKAIDAGTGTSITGDVVDYGWDMAQRTADDLSKIVNPLPADDYESFMRIAIENNIDTKLLPESVKYGPNSFLSRAARSQAEGPGGEIAMKNFEAGLDQVREATIKKMQDFNQGFIPDDVQAGEVIKSGFDNAVERLFQQNDITYSTIHEIAPGIQLTEKAYDKLDSALNGLEKKAMGLLSRGVTQTEKSQGQQLLKAIDAIRAADSSIKQNVEALQMIGRHAFKTSKQALSDVPVDQKAFRKMYDDLREAVVDSTRAQLGDDIADSLVENNARMSKFFDDSKMIQKIIQNEAKAPEQIFQSLILRGNTNTVKALRELLTPEEIGSLKSAFMGSLVKVNPQDDFPFRSLWNALRNKKNVAKELFEPQELKQISELLQLGDRFGNPVLSSSGTGGSNKFMDLIKGVGDYFTNDIVINVLKRQGMKAEEAQAFVKANPEWYQRAYSELSKTVNPIQSQTPAQLGLKGLQTGSAMSIPQTMSPDEAVQLMLNPESAPRETIGGYPKQSTQEVPVELFDQIEEDIDKLDISNTEKAKRLNLLNKHGRVYLGN